MTAIANECSFLRNTLFNIISSETANPANFTSQSAFTRKRQIDLHELVLLPFQLTEESLAASFPWILFKGGSSVSASAVSQARSKINSSLYKNVFNRFNKATSGSDVKTFKGYRLLAVDGSEIQVLPEQDNDITYGASKKGKKRHFVHLNAEFDALNSVFTDALLQPGSEKNEDSALLELARRSSFQKAIFIADRGYEALMSFYRLQKEHIPFVIRIKDETSSTSILKYYKTPDSEEYDIPFNVILTSKNNRHVKDHWDVYKYISSYRKQPEFDGQTTELPLNIRVVRFKAACEGNESFITVCTNLSETEFGTEDIKQIYRLRWQVEVGFRGLKRNTDLEWTHSRKLDLVQSEIYAKMTLYNLCSRLRNKVERSRQHQKRIAQAKKHKQKADFGFIIKTIQQWLFKKARISLSTLEDLLLARISPIREGRADTRKKK